jgi:hypothetical protein
MAAEGLAEARVPRLKLVEHEIELGTGREGAAPQEESQRLTMGLKSF